MNKTSHALIRSKIVAGYTGKDIPDLENILDTQVLALVNLIERAYLTRRGNPIVAVDFGKLADFYARERPLSFCNASPFLPRTDSDARFVSACSKV